MRLLPLKAFCLLGAAAALLLALPATSVKATQGQGPDLAVTISPQTGPAKVGSFLTLRIELTNFGPGTIGTQTLLSLITPSKVAIVNASAADRCEGGYPTLICSAFALGPGESTTMRVTVEPLAPGLLIFAGSAAYRVRFNFAGDPNPFNNFFIQYVRVEP